MKIDARQFDEVARTLFAPVYPLIADQIIQEKVAEAAALAAVQAEAAAEAAGEALPDQVGPGGRKVGANDTKESKDLNQSNNTSRTNESSGTEVTK